MIICRFPINDLHRRLSNGTRQEIRQPYARRNVEQTRHQARRGSAQQPDKGGICSTHSARSAAIGLLERRLSFCQDGGQ